MSRLLDRLLGRLERKDADMLEADHLSHIEKIKKDTATLRDLRESIAEARTLVRETVPPAGENERHE